MPLRDHFRPPLANVTSWEGFHAQWPAVIVQHLRKKLPVGHDDPTFGATPPRYLRRLLSLGAERETDAAGSVVARPGPWAAAADAAIVVGRGPGRPPRSGTELRAGVQRLVDCLTRDQETRQ